MNTKKRKKQDEWSFNLRTQYASSDDSHSDSELDDQTLATVDTNASGLLIHDLDLSTREENVAYKPNPFSIAKINAAYRPTRTVNDSSLQIAQSVRPADKPTQAQQRTKRSCTDSGQTTIMEGFKTQAMKKPRVNGLPLRPTTNPASLDSNPTVNKPVSEKPIVSVSPTKSPATLLSTSADIASSCSISAAMIPNASDFPSASSRLPEYAHISTPKAFHKHDKQTLSTVSQSRIFAPAQLHSDMLPNRCKRSDNHPGFSSFSSPGHPYDDGPLDYDPGIRYSHSYSSPMHPIRESSFRPHLTFAQPFLKNITERGFVPHFPKPSDTKRVSSPGGTPKHSFPIVNIEDRSDYSEELELVSDYVVQANEAPEFPRHSPTFPSASNPQHPEKSLKRRQHVGPRPASLFPSPSLIPNPSPGPSNYLEKRRALDNSSASYRQVKSYPGRYAYQYPTEHPKEEWTTLPLRKKREKKKPKSAMSGNPIYSKSFCVPGLRLPPMTKAEINVTNATSVVPRVNMYLPPPPNSIGVRPRTDKNSIKEIADREHESPSSANFDGDAYPSPSSSTSKLSLLPFTFQAKRTHNQTYQRSRQGVPTVALYRPPSPPTSDPPIPSDADVHLKVDHEGIQIRYPETKRLSRKRRRSSAEVWNLLGVDSCGSVWKDVDGDRHSEQGDIQIVVWSGVPPV